MHRLALGSFSILSGLMLALAVPAAAQEVKELHVMDAGGQWGDAVAKCVDEPLLKDKGIKVIVETPGGYAKLAAQVKAGVVNNVSTDAGTNELSRLISEGLIEKIDWAAVNPEPMFEEARNEYGFGSSYYSTIMAWRKDAAAPKDWAEFFDTEKFPGKRALPDYPDYLLPFAAIADGVAPDEVAKGFDLDRAFKKLEELKPNLALWWSSGAQSVQLLTDGEIDMEAVWNGRAQAAIEGGASADYTYNQGIYDVECFMVLKGTKHKDAAMKIINTMLDAKNQATAASMIDYGPVNPKAFDTGIIPADRKKRLPSAPDNLKVQAPLDAAWYATADADKAFARWTTLLQK